MTAVVFCDGEMESAKKRAIEGYIAGNELEFISDPSALQGGSTLFVCHESVCRLKRKEVSAYQETFIVYGERIVSLKEGADLVRRRDHLVAEGMWKEAKQINEILSDIDFLLQHTENLSYPGYLQIESTRYCNSRCIMCSHYFTNNNSAEHLGMKTLSHMEDALALSRTVALNGMGEPFLSPHASDQIDRYAKYGNRIVTNTNLSVLNNRILRQIRESFDWIAISCDGGTKETYEHIRIGLSFDRLVQNLYTLNQQCPEVKKILTMVIMRQNVKEMPMVVDLAHEVGVDDVTFMSLYPNLVIGNGNDSMDHYPKVLEYYSVKALGAGERYGIHVVVPNVQALDRGITYEQIQDELTRMDSIPYWKSPKEEEKMMETAQRVHSYLQSHDETLYDTVPSKVRCHGVCDWVLRECYSDLQGDVSMCCRNQSFRTGNVDEAGSFYAVWNGRLYRKLREIFYSGYLPEACLRCGLIESGELRYLDVEMSPEFYRDAQYKADQKIRLKHLLEEGGEAGESV